MKISRRGAVDPFIVMDVMEAARAAEAPGGSWPDGVIHMEVGQPGTGAPMLAREAAAKAIMGGALGYTVALGLPELRERISKLYRDWYGLDVPASRIVVTAGSSAAFLLAFLASFEVGDRVATVCRQQRRADRALRHVPGGTALRPLTRAGRKPKRPAI